MALLTPAELLEQLETAITAILGGAQSYSIGDRSYTRADVDKLLQWHNKLTQKITSADAVRRTVAEL